MSPFYGFLKENAPILSVSLAILHTCLEIIRNGIKLSNFVVAIVSIVAIVTIAYIYYKKKKPRILDVKQLREEIEKYYEKKNLEKLNELQKQLVVRRIILNGIIIGFEEIEMLTNLDQETIDTISDKLSSYKHDSETYKILSEILKKNL